jgi:hypothetical protein
MKIYRNGPISGRKDNNKPAFYAKEKQLRLLGYQNIRNPAHIESLAGSGKDYGVYFRVAAQWLMECDCLVYIDDGHPLGSKGCYTETLLAEALKMPLLFCKDDGLYKAVRDRTLLTCGERTQNPLLF